MEKLRPYIRQKYWKRWSKSSILSFRAGIWIVTTLRRKKRSFLKLLFFIFSLRFWHIVSLCCGATHLQLDAHFCTYMCILNTLTIGRGSRRITKKCCKGFAQGSHFSALTKLHEFSRIFGYYRNMLLILCTNYPFPIRLNFFNLWCGIFIFAQ